MALRRRSTGMMSGSMFRWVHEGGVDVEKPPGAEKEAVPQMVEGTKFGEIAADGKLVVTEANGKSRIIRTPLTGVTYGGYSVGCERDGVIYGGGGDGRAGI